MNYSIRIQFWAQPSIFFCFLQYGYPGDRRSQFNSDPKELSQVSYHPAQSLAETPTFDDTTRIIKTTSGSTPWTVTFFQAMSMACLVKWYDLKY